MVDKINNATVRRSEERKLNLSISDEMKFIRTEQIIKSAVPVILRESFGNAI